jgi:hypothetical protein
MKLHKGLEKNGSNAFCDCRSLNIITTPSTVQELGEDAFRDCTDLVSLKLHKGLQRIGAGAFYACGSLKSITIPLTVDSRQFTP